MSLNVPLACAEIPSTCEGYRNVVKHTEPKEVVAQVATVRPDILLLNLIMPNVTGLDILGAMQADPSLTPGSAEWDGW